MPALWSANAFLCGLFTTVYIHRKPVRGDVALLSMIFWTCLVAECYKIVFGTSFLHAVQFSAYFSGIHLLTIGMLTIVYRICPFHPLYRIPGPLLHRITSLNMVLMVSSGYRYRRMRALHQKYGKFVRTGPNTVSIYSSQPIAMIYSTASAWNKSAAYNLSGPGYGLFFIEDKETHNVRQRHFWAPAFTAEALSDYEPMLERRTENLLKALTTRQQNSRLKRCVDMSLALQQWSHDVTNEIIFGDTYDMDLLMNGDDDHLVEGTLLEAQMFEALGESPSLFHVLWHLPATRIFRIMDNVVRRSVERRKRLGSQQADLMTHLLSDRPNGITKLTDADIRKETILAIQAGTNGISSALTFSFFYLAMNMDVQHRLQEELKQVFRDREILDSRALQDLPYLNAVVMESMRLGAPLGSFYRLVPKGGASIEGEYFRQDTIIGIPAWGQMVSEDNFYPEPFAFLPQRWLPDGLGEGSRLNKGAMMTFSHGPFGCIGKQLAHLEMRLVLSKILLRHTLELPPEFVPDKFLESVQNRRVTTFPYPLLVTLSEEHDVL
ncbi:cytochrome P450 [Desarmillaria tabescens]|uniref:Cytochrome P450 n=1 Tax=Armillaria tabescens TaxID=1929756 RepID=A0AA39N6I3_ARMTA|nr:cytochrome P450 [Desarmillaria tabescens]KAK0459244.1 cytochrome P450 [Desarmillaria tabescens]